MTADDEQDCEEKFAYCGYHKEMLTSALDVAGLRPPISTSCAINSGHYMLVDMRATRVAFRYADGNPDEASHLFTFVHKMWVNKTVVKSDEMVSRARHPCRLTRCIL